MRNAKYALTQKLRPVNIQRHFQQGAAFKAITVRELAGILGDIRRIFSRDLLKKAGLSRSQYNQIANYAYTQEEINIRIGNKAPKIYFADILAQCEGGPIKYGAITDKQTLSANLAANCVPETVFGLDETGYGEFLAARRRLMAQKIQGYYKGL